jgi:hypothetical protein
MAVAVEDLVNDALKQISYPRLIGDIYEGSPASIAALQIYSRTRDQLLQQGRWPFAKREVALVAVTGQTPPNPWAFEYTYPSDCLRVRYVKAGPLTGGGRSLDPQPVLFSVWNDQRPATPVRAILSDQSAAILVYTGKITDPAAWEPGFTRAFVDVLAKKLSFPLAKSADIIKARLGLSEQSKAEGMAVDDLAPPQAAPSAPMASPQRQQ